VSNPNCLLSQTCHYLNQGHTFNDILRAAHLKSYFYLSKLNSAKCTESVRILTAMVTDVIKWH